MIRARAGRCSDSSREPTAPTIGERPTPPTTPPAPIPPGVPPKPSGPTCTITGMVSEYRGGPLSGVRI
jgi:hypothetical protein